MNNPNRYHIWAALECHAFSKAEAVLRFSAEEDGMWVQWQDYARLKAEVAYLKGEEHPYTELGSMMPKYLLEHWVKENARLKAEVERLRSASFVTAVPVEEYEKLKAEVERLISVSEAWKKRRLDKVEAECIKWSDYEKLKAENERLRKAGDAMAEGLLKYIEPTDGYLTYLECRANWNAAKEGKQP